MHERENFSAAAEAGRSVAGGARRADEPQRQDALLRYLGVVTDIASRRRSAPPVKAGSSATATQRGTAGATSAPRPEAVVGMLLVREVMDTPAPSVRGDAPFAEVARELSRERVGSLPVLDAEGQVMGVISEADLLARAAVEGTGHRPGALARARERELSDAARKETAEGLMTAPAITVHPEATVAEAAWLASLSRLKRLPVVDHEGQLVGTVHRRTLLEALVGDDGLRSEIEAVLRANAPEAADTVRVSVRTGHVTLTGSASGADVARVLTDIRKIDGVKELTDRLIAM
ncbi:CBS domain-containing protein [Streptomyces sp. HUAS TT3]|uniref:CBS domain-containing protein n=1 Tax=Streptomyces sp. HUAS TT3 TaxID=3447510 RepID=UPI003F65B521